MPDWNKLKVVDLKAELSKRGLPQTGLKAALVARLTEAENADGSESEATVQGEAGKQDATESSNTVSPVEESSASKTETLSIQIPSQPQQQPSSQPPEPTDGTKEIVKDEPQTDVNFVQPATQIEPSQPPQSEDRHQSALPSVEPQEIIDDRHKRKRRSQSPPPSSTDVAKRVRQDATHEADIEMVTSQADALWVEKHNAVDFAEVNADAMEVAVDGEGAEPGPTIVDVAKEEVQVHAVDDPVFKSEEMDIDRPKTGGGTDDNSPSRTRDSRFKDLFPTSQKAPLEQPSLHDSAVDAMAIDTDRPISPALHPATSALYIRDFMRPLNSAQLKSHLTTLATPPGQESDADVILNFYLDPIRTHAFVSLTSVSAAARVRSAIHDRIWPDEKTRKPLWADFVPAEKIDEWIEQEQSDKSGGRIGGKKWEVYYDVDENQTVTALLQEASNFPRAQPVRQPSGPSPAKPRGIEGAPLGPRAQLRAAVSSAPRLNELFKVTTAKPALYYMPVSKELADKRLDNIDIASSKRLSGRPVGGEINRYTFENNTVLVDRGPEIFSGIRPPQGHRGPPPRAAGPRGVGGGPRREYGGERRFDERFSYRPNRRDSKDDRRY